MKWLRAHWVPVVVGVVGFSVGAIAGAGGKAKTTTETVAGPGVTNTVTRTVTRHAKPRVIVKTKTQTHTVTVTTPAAPAATATPVSSGGGGGGGGGEYSGDGEKSVGTISVSTDSTLHWTCRGDCTVFGITSDADDNLDSISVDSANNATSGDTAVSAGTYHNVDVISTGSWSFTISPG
jgi:hypothetical protein